ncbi:PPM-type phosphatase domain-containing protein [Aphelenchoides besseyi]|nr:PPM-type phosphatase domain-containing protein [Aphelenchoides besseyi]KAI6201518.1 PPM-type phosphatase domain-containing protein [Aphelenchoides besseyi]
MSDEGDFEDERLQLRELIKNEWSNLDETQQQNLIVQGISPPPLLKELLPAVPGPSGQLPPGVLPEPEDSPVIRRFKAPFDATTKHDARGDAVSLCYDHLIQKRVPVWAAHLLAYQFVDLPEIKQKFRLENLPFEPDNYENIPAYTWCKDLIQEFIRYMKTVGEGKVDIPAKPTQCNRWPICFTGFKNRKPRMEDRHIVLPSFACLEPKLKHISQGKDDDAFLAVFDGHNGHETAAYLAAHFHRAFLEPEIQDEDVIEHVKRTYNYVDQRLNLRSEKANYRSGSTVAGVLIRHTRLIMFWCGDASIGILHCGTVNTLSRRHIPSDQREHDRVLAAGGTIVNVAGDLRVNGVLNITRSMGDLMAKPIIVSDPEISTYDLTNEDWLLFVASDGVWDELSPSEIRDNCILFARKYEQNEHIHLSDYIVSDTRKAGGRDNMTLIILFLQPISDLWNHLRSMQTTMERRNEMEQRV